MSGAHRPRKRFGQHFLTDSGLIHDIVQAIGAESTDTLVEVGPGQGAITEPLLQSGAELHAIEFDRDLAARLRERYRHHQQFHLHEADALQFDVKPLGQALRVIGNLPYNISTPLLFHLLESVEHIADMHFMLQKEVVERMAAEPGSKRYGRLTVMLGAHLQIEALFDVPPEAFTPPPKVMSAVVRLEPRRQPLDIRNQTMLQTVVRQAFSQRRKTLRNTLRDYVDEAALEAAGIDPNARAETVPVENWVTLSNWLAAGQR